MRQAPRRWIGPGAFAKWANDLRDFAVMTRVISGEGYRVSDSDRGSVLGIDVPAAGGSASATPIALHPCSYIQSFKLYITAIDQVTGQEIQIAKPDTLGQPAVNIIDGVVWTFNYLNGGPTNQSRTKSNGTYSEPQRITEPYYAAQVAGAQSQPASIIWAINTGRMIVSSEAGDPLTPTGTAITWLDLNPQGRAWGATPDGLA